MPTTAVIIAAQEFYAIKDDSKALGEGIKVCEGLPYRITTPEEVVIGRELCLPQEVFFPPACDLCSVMGKELVCEGLPGSARIVWCTHTEMDSEVWVGLVQGGPYDLQTSSGSEIQCHDFTIPILAIDSTHYFYVKSTSTICGTLQSAEFIFCAGGEVTIRVSGLSMFAVITSAPPKSVTEVMGGDEFTNAIATPSNLEVSDNISTTTVLSTKTPKAVDQTMGASEFGTRNSNVINDI